MVLKSYREFKATKKKKGKRRLNGDFITGAVTGILGTALLAETTNIINS